MIPRGIARPRVALVVGMAVAATVTYVAMDALRFPLGKDELHYWPATLLFSRFFPPSGDQLREYPELSTPLTYLLFGALHHLLGWGYVAARHIMFLVGVAMAFAVGMRSPPDSWRGPLAAAGLLSYPYFLFASTHYYPDVLASALVLAGIISFSHGRFILAGVWFALAVSARQYMVAFPIAAMGVAFAEDPRLRRLAHPSVWGPALAVFVLGAWFVFFGGYGPELTVARQAIPTATPSVVLAQNSLYFLSCIGAYYVLPELVVLRGPFRPGWSRRRLAALAVALALAFALFPPLSNEGPTPAFGLLDRTLKLAVPDPVRVLVFYALALLAVLRFSDFTLESACVLIYALLMAKAHLAWDKYALPVLLVLWWIAATSRAPEATPDVQRSAGAPRIRTV